MTEATPVFAVLVVLPVALALALDHGLGEPRRWHPLVGFGLLATRLEKMLRNKQGNNANERLLGLLGWSVLVLLPVSILLVVLALLPGFIAELLSVAVLYFCIGLRSLQQHALQVAAPLLRGDLNAARAAVGRIVSRDTAGLSAEKVSAAAVESVLENGSDAVFAPIFWFVVAGAPGALAYRLINTLDAMWGYRNDRYLQFGYVAARVDDVANWVPARLCALTYCLVGNFSDGWCAMRQQGGQSSSPNAGRVMAAGAGALGIELGGPSTHAGVEQWRPQLGFGRSACPEDIHRAVSLLHRAVLLWLLLGFVLGLLTGLAL